MRNVESASRKQPATHPGMNAPENIQIEPTGEALGAESRGVDLSKPIPEATKELMREPWAAHLVLLWLLVANS